MSGLTVRRFFEEATQEHPTTPFLVWSPDGSALTYEQMNARADRAARLWHDLGVRRGDRVAFVMDNSPEFVWAWLGLAKVGGILVAVNTGYHADEASYVVDHAGCRAALVGQRHVSLIREVAARCPSLDTIIVHASSPGQAGGFPSLDAAMAEVSPDVPDAAVSEDDTISLIYTSGTTGRPKGVMQTHRNYVLTGQAYPVWMGMERGDRIYACLPLFHINSQAYSTMGAIGIAGTVVLAPRFSASRFWPEVRRHRVNVFNFIGAMTVILSKHETGPQDRDNDVRVAYGVPALPAALRDEIEQRFSLRVLSGFGMSETTFGLVESVDGERRPGSMGKPRHHPDPALPRTEARVVDSDDNDLLPGQVGELLLRNAAMMKGYYRAPDLTAEALKDGWLHTGDSVYRDEDGFYYFVDRLKDIIRRRGENVSSLEVEQVLNDHPDVQESAVVGVPSEFMDEEIVAFVVARADRTPSVDDLVEWCAERLAAFKVPRHVEVLDEIPKTPTEKTQKAALRERARRATAEPAAPTSDTA